MSFLFLADMGTNSAKGMALLHACSQGRSRAAAHGVQLVGDQQRGNAGLEQAQHLGVGQGEAAGLHHEQNQVHIADGAHHRLVERFVQRGAVLGLETRGVHKDELGLVLGADAGDAVARGLRLARGDADLLPHQRVHQRGLAHVGLADDGDQAAALLFHRHFAHGPERFPLRCGWAWRPLRAWQRPAWH
jgi:hypothetical protein